MVKLFCPCWKVEVIRNSFQALRPTMIATVIDEAMGKTAEDARSPAPATTTNPQTPSAARPSPSPEEVAEAIASIEQRKRELGLEPIRQDERPALPVGDLEQSVVDVWKTDAAVRAEFVSLERYSAFRKGVAARRIGGFDSQGEKLVRTDPVARAIHDGDEEDRTAGVDPRLPVETRARQVWGLNPQVRKEFGDVERYIEWRRRAERSRG
jgi:hypothetical protein